MLRYLGFNWRLWIPLLSTIVAASPDFTLAIDSTSPGRPPIGDDMAPPETAKSDPVANSVVKVFCTTRYPDLYKPWTKQAPSEVAGTGVIIEGKRILTCAHVVLYASQVQIQANQAGDKVSATVDAIAPGIDLALLKLDDESFFDSHPALKRWNALPDIRDAVMAYGYPTGGNNLSITKGIISRIEFASYNYSVSGLRIQIDAAVNPGNSGGPAVVGDQMIGLAFSHLSNAQNISYIIPNEEIDLFLKDIADGHYDGKPAMFDDFQSLQNAALRASLKLDHSVSGVIVHRPDSDDPSYPLKLWDVVTKIGDTPIDDQGSIRVNGNLRLFFKYMIQKTVHNGKVPLTLLRSGKQLHVEVPVAPRRPMVIPDLEGTYPSYFVYGPLVFSTATSSFVGGLFRVGSQSGALAVLGASGSPLLKRLGEKTAFDGERLVVVSSPLFPHKLSKGYANPALEVVKNINGTRVRNLEHLVRLLRDCKDDFVTFEFEGRIGETLVFPRAETVAATEDILTDNDVRSQGSPDTLAVWNGR